MAAKHNFTNAISVVTTNNGVRELAGPELVSGPPCRLEEGDIDTSFFITRAKPTVRSKIFTTRIVDI